MKPDLVDAHVVLVAVCIFRQVRMVTPVRCEKRFLKNDSEE